MTPPPQWHKHKWLHYTEWIVMMSALSHLVSSMRSLWWVSYEYSSLWKQNYNYGSFLSHSVVSTSLVNVIAHIGTKTWIQYYWATLYANNAQRVRQHWCHRINSFITEKHCCLHSSCAVILYWSISSNDLLVIFDTNPIKVLYHTVQRHWTMLCSLIHLSTGFKASKMERKLKNVTQ